MNMKYGALQSGNHITVRLTRQIGHKYSYAKGKYTESLTFSTPNCIYADYGKLGKPSLHPLKIHLQYQALQSGSHIAHLIGVPNMLCGYSVSDVTTRLECLMFHIHF